MSLCRGSVGALFFIAILCSPVATQEIVSKGAGGGASPAPSPKPTQRVKQKTRPGEPLPPDLTEALFLIENISDLTTDIKDDQTRVQIQARVADALWEFNQDRARALFEKAFSSIDSIKFENKKGVTSILKELSEQSQLRREVLQLASKHDPNLSTKLLKSVAEPATAASSSLTVGTVSARASLYLQIAVGIADSDPNGAAQMISASLESGIDPQIAPALVAVRHKNAATADALFRTALQIAQRDIAQAPLTINYLAPYVFPNYGQGINYLQFDYSSPATPQANKIIDEFLRFSYSVLTREIAAAKPGASATQAAINYSTAKVMLPYFDQYMPDAAVVIRTGLNQLSSLLRVRDTEMIDTFTGFNDIDDILQKAEKAQQQEIKDAIYSHAAILSARNGDTDRALSIVEKIQSESLRSDFDSIIRYQAAIAAIGKSDADLALRYAKNIADLQMYATAMSRLATLLKKKRDFATAGEILTTATRTIAKAENGFEKVCAMLIITNVTAELDPVRGFELMSAAVQIINQTDIHLNRSSVLARAETKPTVLSVFSTSSGLNALKFDESFAWLARSDFQRALSLARSLDKKEAEVLAQLAACKGLILKTKEASMSDKNEPPKTSETPEQSIRGANVKQPEERKDP